MEQELDYMTKRKHIKDKDRFSIIQDELDYCMICRRYLGEGGHLHEVFWGSANRQKSKDYGLVVKLCFNHHDRQSIISVHHNPQGKMNKWLQQQAREAFENHYPNEDFIEVFGRNYGTCDGDTE